MIASPCTGVCTLDRISGLCVGCLRSRDEIAVWGTASDRQKLQILAQIADRESAGTRERFVEPTR
ncbi:DUF1289 domain-containing protein [Methyloversatilis thermotolerans]|uniref:DUF1289 domain-containing protein n=1 Tax=Methyloversatilis thermotolerans TaxID=1346290 RepID=UPI00037E00DE|nr:DUF1289 domain-containing protein [Methyloversatilis thermotolerans]